MASLDLLISDVSIVDGSGKAPFQGDVAVQDGMIVALGARLATGASATERVDGQGKVLMPGFIDIHTHSDVSLRRDPTASSKLVQGVTTEVVGNCGFSPFPTVAGQEQAARELVMGLGTGEPAAVWSDFDDYGSDLQACEPAMNVAALVGHGALRIAAMGTTDRAITPADVERMGCLLRTSLEQGAFGLSTGLTYVPSRFAADAEIHALAAIVQASGGLYATHGRTTSDPLGTFREAIEVGGATGVRVQFSHVALNDPRAWGCAQAVTELFEDAVGAGIDVRYDVYPYEASASSLTQYLPAWLQEAGEDGISRQVRDPLLRERARRDLSQGLFGFIPWDWTRVLISLTGNGDEDLQGVTVSEAAARHQTSAEELCLDLCARHGNHVQVILFYRHQEDVDKFVAHPLSVIGSDGNALVPSIPGQPHPRSFGAHARLLQTYVHQRRILSLADAVHKSTMAAADRLGLADRGRIAVGAVADLVLADPSEVRECATWISPKQLAKGIDAVWVNGVLTVSNGSLTGACAGRVLRRGA